MVRDFIQENKEIWQGKKVFCMTTMGLFSGDGTGCAARLLKKYGATITGGLAIMFLFAGCVEGLDGGITLWNFISLAMGVSFSGASVSKVTVSTLRNRPKDS